MTELITVQGSKFILGDAIGAKLDQMKFVDFGNNFIVGTVGGTKENNIYIFKKDKSGVYRYLGDIVFIENELGIEWHVVTHSRRQDKKYVKVARETYFSEMVEIWKKLGDKIPNQIYILTSVEE